MCPASPLPPLASCSEPSRHSSLGPLPFGLGTLNHTWGGTSPPRSSLWSGQCLLSSWAPRATAMPRGRWHWRCVENTQVWGGVGGPGYEEGFGSPGCGRCVNWVITAGGQEPGLLRIFKGLRAPWSPHESSRTRQGREGNLAGAQGPCPRTGSCCFITALPQVLHVWPPCGRLPDSACPLDTH